MQVKTDVKKEIEEILTKFFDEIMVVANIWDTPDDIRRRVIFKYLLKETLDNDDEYEKLIQEYCDKNFLEILEKVSIRGGTFSGYQAIFMRRGEIFDYLITIDTQDLEIKVMLGTNGIFEENSEKLLFKLDPIVADEIEFILEKYKEIITEKN